MKHPPISKLAEISPIKLKITYCKGKYDELNYIKIQIFYPLEITNRRLKKQPIVKENIPKAFIQQMYMPRIYSKILQIDKGRLPSRKVSKT